MPRKLQLNLIYYFFALISVNVFTCLFYNFSFPFLERYLKPNNIANDCEDGGKDMLHRVHQLWRHLRTKKQIGEHHAEGVRPLVESMRAGRCFGTPVVVEESPSCQSACADYAKPKSCKEFEKKFWSKDPVTKIEKGCMITCDDSTKRKKKSIFCGLRNGIWPIPDVVLSKMGITRIANVGLATAHKDACGPRDFITRVLKEKADDLAVGELLEFPSSILVTDLDSDQDSRDLDHEGDADWWFMCFGYYPTGYQIPDYNKPVGLKYPDVHVDDKVFTLVGGVLQSHMEVRVNVLEAHAVAFARDLQHPKRWYLHDDFISERHNPGLHVILPDKLNQPQLRLARMREMFFVRTK